MALRKEYDVLVDDDLVLAAVDDFCRLTVRHRVRKAGTLDSPFDAADGRAESMDSLESRRALARPRKHSPAVRYHSLTWSSTKRTGDLVGSPVRLECPLRRVAWEYLVGASTVSST